MTECKTGKYVRYEDVEELQKEVDHLKVYTDHLVSFSKLPCLPKDLENLREVNLKIFQENEKLKKELEKYREQKCDKFQELKDGDIIQKGDLFLNDENEWELVEDACLFDSGYPIGYEYCENFHLPMKRKLNI
jgi:hypothetical protein